MSEDLRIKVTYDVDDSKLNQSLAKIQSNTSKALAGGSGSGGSGAGGGTPQTAIDRTLLQANKLQDRVSLLRDSFSKLASQPGQERQLAKVSQELATQFGHYKNMAKTSSDYLSFLEKEVNLRKQAAQLTNQANKNEGVYSAHSQRQFAMLQQISGQVPGGGIINKFISGATRGAAGAAESGMGGGLSGGLAGGGIAAAAGVAALAVAAVVQEMGKLANRAQELSQSASSASSSLGQLRSQTERGKIQQDANAASSGVTIASAQQWLQQTGNSILGGAIQALTGKSDQSKQQDIAAAIGGGIGGDAKETWRRIKEQGQDTQLDLARQRQGLDIQQYRQNRDFALDLKQFQIDTANQKFDLQKQAQRQEQDYTLAKQQYDENFAGKMAKQEFDLQQKYATQSYQISQQRATQDFTLQMQDRAYDFGVSRARATQDYSISRNDKAYDFGVSQSRNQEEFNVNRGRQGQDYQENLMKMALGGASGKDYLFASMDFRKEQQREQEDFNRQKQYAQQDYTVSAGRDLRNFGLSQSRGQEDFNLANQRDIRGFGISQGRMSQDFQLQQQQAKEGRELQIETELYNRKYEGIQLELQHNRNLQDASIALQRFTQATGMQGQRLANQGADITQDQSLANRDFNISAYRALRGQAYNEQDFAGQMRKDNPLGAYGQTLTDPTFAAASARYAQATGQLPLSDQVSSALNGGRKDTPGGNILGALGSLDFGNILGQAIVQSIPGLSLIGNGIGFLGGLFGGGGNSQGGGTASFNPVHNVTFPAVGGVSDAQFQSLQQQYQRDLQALDSKYASLINAGVGANVVF